MSKDQLDNLHERVFPEMLMLKLKARSKMNLPEDGNIPTASGF